jgi:homocysteine S-methyltransferase
MGFVETLAQQRPILCGGSVFERMRRRADLHLDEHVAHSALIHDEAARAILVEVHREYVAAARDAGLPAMVLAATWRASRERVEASRFAGRPLNEDNVAFVRALQRDGEPPLLCAGVLGPRGDAYRPEEALGTEAAADYHAWQAERLAAAGVDVLVAMTCPAVSEARGLARAMAATGVPYMVSFVVRDDGTVLDGTPLADAVARLDDDGRTPPVGYLVNCVHPTVFERALDAHAPTLAARIVGLKANTSALRPEELDGSAELVTEPPDLLADHMARVQRRFGLAVVGGCCGTGTEHVRAIAQRMETRDE